MFGDNLSFISDMTIAATKGAGCEMKDKFKLNFKIALPAAIFAAAMYTIFGSGTNADVAGTAQIEIIKIFPYLAVLIMASCGMDVIYVLGIGILASAVIGFMTGSLDFFSLCANMKSGIGGMYSICLMALVLKGIVGRIQTMGGIDWIVSKAAGNVKTRKGAQYFLAAFTSIIDVCIGNNTICIIIGADVLKPLMKKFKIAPQRFASLLDIFACIIPGISPLGINVMAALALLAVHFDLFKTDEEKAGKEFYALLVERFEKRGEAAFVHATQRYAEQRGARMAQRAIRYVRELNFLTYREYGEWVNTQTVKDMDMAKAGTVYCTHLDSSVVRGFNPYTLKSTNTDSTGDGQARSWRIWSS